MKLKRQFLLSCLAFGAANLIFASAIAQSIPCNGAPNVMNDRSVDKYNAYVSSFNALTNMFYGSTQGMGNLLSKLEGQRLEARTGSGGDSVILYLNTSMLRNSVEAMHQGVLITDAGPYCALDSLVQNIYPEFTALLKVSRNFESYVKAKKYLDDDFALGRELGGETIRLWRQVNVEYERLGQALSQAERISRLQSIAEHKANGEFLDAALNETMLFSCDLIDVALAYYLSANKSKADTIVRQLELALSEVRLRSEEPNSSFDSSSLHRIGLIAGYMDNLLGGYRELKSTLFGAKSVKEKRWTATIEQLANLIACSF